MDYFFIPTICNEADVPKYTLPPLGSREEMRNALADWEYGRLPMEPPRMEAKLIESGNALDGLGTRKQFRVQLANATGNFAFDLLLYLPRQQKQRPYSSA